MKPSKSALKELRSIAEQLPKTYTAANQTTLVKVSGAEIITEGGVQVNHFKRILRMWEANRKESIQNYIREVFQLSGAHNSVLIGLQNRINSII